MKNPSNVKGRFFLHLISVWVFLSGCGNVAVAQFSGELYGKTVIGGQTTEITGNITLKSTGELYFGAHSPQGLQTNTLVLNGNYTGENGSRVYLSVTDNSNQSGTKGFIDILGTANQAGGGTKVELDLFDDWDGSTIDLIRVERVNSDTNAFYMEETEYSNHIAVLLCRIERNSLIWYITQKDEPKDECIDLIHQKLNNTLVVNNNPQTNGGYEFVYYTWYKNGVKIVEGSHESLSGHYYTGGENLSPYDEYWVELIDTKGNTYRSCPFMPTIKTFPVSISAYPNPVKANYSRKVTVEISGMEKADLQTATVDIYSLLGTHLGSVQVDGRTHIPVEMPNMTGVYLLKFQSEKEKKAMKIIVE